MGFLSPYAGDETIDLGGGYWVRVKRSLTVAEAEDAERVLLQSARNVNGQVVTDRAAYLREQVLASILDWNLDDENGVPLPLDHDPVAEKASSRPSPRRRSIARLPQSAFDKIALVVGRHNNVDPEADARFRGGSESVPALGADDAPDDRQIRVGEPVLAGAGSAPGPDPGAGASSERNDGVSDVDGDDGGAPPDPAKPSDETATETLTV